MRVKTGNVSLWLSALSLAACSDGSANMSCPLKAETCWNTAVAEAQACVPATTGVLGADNKTCTFDDGTVAVFDQPLAFPVSVASTNASVTITKNGTQCARFVQNETIVDVTLTTASGPHRIETTLSGLTLTCGDGTKLATKWSDCTSPSGGFDATGQPALTFSGDGAQISFFVQGYFVFDGGYSSFDSWFSCVKP
jgi:hypothetical protein